MKKAAGVHAIGRRKRAVARVYLTESQGATEEGGRITVNGRSYEEHFGRATLRMVVNQPLELLEKVGKYDVLVNVSGGGLAGQAGALRHGLSRVLTKLDAENRPALKKAGFLSRDSREVERKKYGRHKARRRPQFSKR